jgi:hypothetical protein
MVGICISGLAFMRGTLFWSWVRWFYRDFTRQAKGYTVWSTLEPLREDLHTWASVIQVGSATASIRVNKCTLEIWLALKMFLV